MKKLMVVDDNDLIRKIAARILRRAGYTVIEAVNGLDALHKLNSNEVDMVITDLRMPEMDGLELIKELRAVPAYTYLPVVVMSAELQEYTRIEAEKAGAIDWITKPFLRHQLIAAVSKSALQEI